MSDLFKVYTRTQEKIMVQLTEENAEELAKFFGWSVLYSPGGRVIRVNLPSGYAPNMGGWYTPEGDEVIDTKGWTEVEE